MIKDLFVDNNVAKNFKNPADPEYQKLMTWLFKEGHLVLTPKLLAEYHSSNQGNFGQSITTIINQLTISGRLVRISTEEMKAIKFSKRLDEKCLKLNKDYWHLKAILLSNRKIAIIIDKAFRDAVNNHPKFEGVQASAVVRPEELDYQNYTV
ncbi:hypothetical protein BH09BAC4_BH09BAC4_49670 [soil metagenome]